MTLDETPPDVTGLTTTTVLNLDTANGVPASGSTTTSTATNNDLITRDATPTEISGTLSRVLVVGEVLQISIDGGSTWTDTTLTGLSWTSALSQTYTTDASFTMKFRVRDTAGNVADLTGQDKTVVIDLTSPTGITTAPVVPDVTTISTSYTFNSATYGVLEAGTTISLVNDVNNNGMWQEGLDKVLASAVVAANGSWTITTTLPAGALNLAFMVWDVAGNVSSISAINSVGVASSASSSQIITTAWGGTTDGYNGMNAASVSLNSEGQWSFLQSTGYNNSTYAYQLREYIIQDANILSAYTSTILTRPSISNDTTYNGFISGMAYVDLDRDGDLDVIGQYSSYGGSKAPVWINNGDGTYTAYGIQLSDTVHLTGIVAFDMRGDGYLDFLQGDADPSSTVFVFNSGTITANASNVITSFTTYEADDGVATTGIPNGVNMAFNHNISVVDLNNDGITEIAGQAYVGGTNTAYGFTADGTSRSLVVLYHDQTSNKFTAAKQYTNLFDNDGFDNSGALAMSMSWADFNKDGYLDLYLNRGTDTISGHTNDNESRIYTNTNGTLSSTPSYWFGDNKSGGTSFAVDWNLDGKMDIIEVPNNYATAFAPTLYINNTVNASSLAFSSGTALSGSYSDISGAVVLDYDWDGTMELVLYHAAGNAAATSATADPTTIIKNTNIAADGTSLHIRILAGDGTNIFYGNTVKLYDSHGNLVSTQVINAQTSGSSNSMGLIDFYGLNSTETYSIQLINSISGTTNNVSGVSTLGGISNTLINSSWSGLTTGKANEAYVLTAESGSAVNNSASNGVGIVGTGYNDHFFGTLGNDHYNGGGGWIINAAGVKEWVAKGGEDVLDYSLLTAQISINVATATATKIIGGITYTDTFENVEKFITGSGNTTFTGGSGNDYFVGGQGNDTYNLGGAGGGRDTIYFTLLNTNTTGGNGSDIVNGFHIGKVSTDSNADIIDIHELLSDYKGTPSLYTDSDGVKLDISSSQILDYLKISSDGNNTTIAIDRDGGADSYSTILTLNGVNTDLITLLMNNQLVI